MPINEFLKLCYYFLNKITFVTLFIYYKKNSNKFESAWYLDYSNKHIDIASEKYY